MSIAANIQKVQTKIRLACERASRSFDEVTLVAVSKTVDSEQVEEAYEFGLRDFGENRPQELERKTQALKHLPDIRWHMIGHLQRNKVKMVLPCTNRIHSVDSESLLNELDKRSANLAMQTQVLLEVNVSGEESKYGLTENEAMEICRQNSRWPHVSFTGLMTMAPFVNDPEKTRPVFNDLRRLKDRIRMMEFSGDILMEHLSMGMSNDYEVAVEEGATLVRVGTAIWKGSGVA